MVNDFMVCVDRIIASTYLQSLNNHHRQDTTSSSSSSSTQQHQHLLLSVTDKDTTQEGETSSNLNKDELIIKECRICQEEDDHLLLESPCACNGTLKYAHRICIQKWCNKKGDITCEICHQDFAPNYSLPPPKLNPEVMAVDISQPWDHHFGFRDHDFLALAAAERQFLESEYEEYAASDAGNVTCLRSITIILMFVLLIHQILMVTRDFGLVQGYSTFFHFQVSFLQLAGFILPCYVLVRSWYILHTRRRRQG